MTNSFKSNNYYYNSAPTKLHPDGNFGNPKLSELQNQNRLNNPSPQLKKKKNSRKYFELKKMWTSIEKGSLDNKSTEEKARTLAEVSSIACDIMPPKKATKFYLRWQEQVNKYPDLRNNKYFGNALYFSLRNEAPTPEKTPTNRLSNTI
jgi:hypothetical protein